MNKLIRAIFIVAFTFCFGTTLHAQNEPDTSKWIMLKIDFGSMIDNYPSAQFSIDYIPTRTKLISLSFGPVFSTEFFYMNNKNFENHKAYKIGLGAKHLFTNKKQRKSLTPYIGLKYFYTRSKFDTDYVVLIGERFVDEYYMNVSDSYIINKHSINLNIGFITWTSEKTVTQIGIGLAYFITDITPTQNTFGGRIIKNGFYFDDPNATVWEPIFEGKIGFLLSK